jgi:hypothetical protein
VIYYLKLESPFWAPAPRVAEKFGASNLFTFQGNSVCFRRNTAKRLLRPLRLFFELPCIVARITSRTKPGCAVSNSPYVEVAV